MKKHVVPFLCLTLVAVAAGCVRSETENRPSPVVEKDRVIERDRGSDNVDVHIHDYR